MLKLQPRREIHMATKKLKLNTETNMFGTNVWLETSDGSKKWQMGDGLSYDPSSKLSKKIKDGYLFRSPGIDPELLSEIWDTIESFTGQLQITAQYDDKEDSITTYARIQERGDATMFAFAHNTFEKWSDEKEADEKAKAKQKQKALSGTVNDDGTVRVTMEVETLGD